MTPLEKIGPFADVPIDIVAELDRRFLKMEAILELQVGSIISLTRSAGENIDIIIGGAAVGCGEIVVLENMLGVRITDFRGDP
jgi:flagellar motor switch protein FliN